MPYISNGQEYTYGLKTKSQIDSIIPEKVGDTVFNTDYNRVETWDGSFWTHPHLVQMINRTGGAVVEGDVVILDAANDDSFIQPTAADQPILGVVYKGGANLATCLLTIVGECKVLADGTTPIVGDMFFTTAASFAALFDGTADNGAAGNCINDSGGANQLNDCVLLKREWF